MITTVIAGVMTALSLIQQTDTTIQVTSGSRLQLNTQGGAITVQTWNRDQIRVQAEHSSRTSVNVSRSGSVVSVRSRGQYGPGGIVDYKLTVPAGIALELSGLHSDITVSGVRGEVIARTVEGDVSVKGGRGRIAVQSVNGTVTIEDAEGKIEAKSVSDDVRITGASGDVVAETVSGDVTLRNIQSANVTGSTVSGDVTYAGTIRNSGRYSFVSHSGDVKLEIPENSNATFSVATMSGDIRPRFRVTLPATRPGRRMSFTLGNGSARVELESFSGDILIGPNTTNKDN